MQLHPRKSIVDRAKAAFTVYWLEAQERLALNTYAESYLVWNQIDRYWIDVFKSGKSTKDAAVSWSAANFSQFEISTAMREIGSEFARLVEEHELTYGEISAILLDIRESDAKYQIRSERHPNDPDKPGGLA